MTDSIDDLLAQVKAQFSDEVNEVKQTPLPQSPSPAVPPVQSSTQETTQPSGSPPRTLDSLLAELEGKPTQPNSLSQSASPSTVKPQPAPQPKPLIDQTSRSLSVELAHDPLMAQLKAQYSELDRAEALEQQKQLVAEQRRKEQARQQQRAALVKQAEDWLKTLDPRAGEGAWFEEFAAKYTSRIEAAIDYLGLNHQNQS